jgi:DNA-binding transcriptional MerR regulator
MAMITIGQLAAYTGVTIKTVRHYHARGLLAEPPRDASGYRRYSAADAIDLLKIRALADAGVPLARVKELLDADSEVFAAAIAEIDARLLEKAREIRNARRRLTALTTGDSLFVSAEVADYLDRLRALGVSERMVRTERDGWILMQATSPNAAAAWIADKLDALTDPEFRDLYLTYDTAFDWSPDDPRLADLVDRTRRWVAARDAERQDVDPRIVKLITTQVGESPAWDRLAELGKRRTATRDQ